MEDGKQLSRGDRSGLLQQPEQRSTDLAVLQPGVREEAPPLRVAILVALTRALIRENPNGDVLALAMGAAQHESGATDEEMARLKIAILSEAEKSPWPKGFF